MIDFRFCLSFLVVGFFFGVGFKAGDCFLELMADLLELLCKKKDR